MLTLAIQKSGRLHNGSLKLLESCGIQIQNGGRQLRTRAINFPLEIYYLRNSDIPGYLEDGIADITILGQNELEEQEVDLKEIIPLGFSTCRLSIAIPKNISFNGLQDLNGKRIATSYPNSLKRFLTRAGISASVHTLSGSVEIAPNIDLADAVCDLVSTGSTLFQNGLKEVETILHSQAALFSRSDLSDEKNELLQSLLTRIKSVLDARSSKYILMNVPNDKIQAVSTALPVLKSPTVMPLAIEGWSSVHTVIQEEDFWESIATLKRTGAQDILVIPIEKIIR